MAPEQLEKPGTVDHRADIYSLGVVFYEMLTGELPLGRFQPPSHKVEMDVRLDEVVLHALEKEPSRRYQQASQVKTAVETIAGGQPPPAPVSPAPPPDRFWRRMAVAMAVLCLVLIVLVIGFARQLHLANQRPVASAPTPSEETLLLRSLLAAQKAAASSPKPVASAPSPSEETLLLRSLLAAQKAAASSPKASVPGGGTEEEAAPLVFDSQLVVGQDHQALIWHARCLIPADHLARLVFVVWSNGVPAIQPRLSGYLKATQKPVVLQDMQWTCDKKRVGPDGATNTAAWYVYLGWLYTAAGGISNQPPSRKLETAPRSVLHSGHQLAIRLAEFDRTAGFASNGWSGVEIRLFLQPLTSPAVRTDPNEVEGANYVAGFGLDGESESSILKLIKELPIEPQPVEKSP